MDRPELTPDENELLYLLHFLPGPTPPPGGDNDIDAERQEAAAFWAAVSEPLHSARDTAGDLKHPSSHAGHLMEVAISALAGPIGPTGSAEITLRNRMGYLAKACLRIFGDPTDRQKVALADALGGVLPSPGLARAWVEAVRRVAHQVIVHARRETLEKLGDADPVKLLDDRWGNPRDLKGGGGFFPADFPTA